MHRIIYCYVLLASQSYEEKQLISLVSAGDQHAFSILFEKYYKRIYGTALQLIKVQVLAEDIAQQVFLQVWERRAQLANVTLFAPWLYQIAKNLAADFFRKQLLEERYVRFALEILENSGDSPEDLLIHRQRTELLKRSLDGLSNKQREVYRLSREEGKTYQEIADELGISKDTVKEYIQIAVGKIKEYLLTHREELISMVVLSKYFNNF